VKAGRPNIGLVWTCCGAIWVCGVLVDCDGSGEEGLESVRGSIGRVWTGADILRDVTA
jgi:hypothetical protein